MSFHRSNVLAPRFIPTGAVKVSDRHSDAVAYVYTSPGGRLCAVVFWGKQAKPIARHSYRTASERERDVARHFQARQAHLAGVKDARARRTARNDLAVGDILTTCWGHEQTNREAFQVREVQGRYVVLRQIAMALESRGYMRDTVVPQSDAFIGKPMRKLVQWGTSVRIDDSRMATKWNIGVVAGVPVGPALETTSYG